MPRPFPLALCLVLAACGTEPTPPPPDAPAPDVVPEIGSDAAVEIGPDVELDAPADQPVEAGPDAAPDLVVEVGVDAAEEAAPDVSAPDVAGDRPVEAGPDAAPDVPPPCAAGTMRCAAGGGPEFCVGGAWVAGSCGDVSPLPGTALACFRDACYVCRRADGGAGCGGDALCAADTDCIRQGLARCVEGRCAQRGAIRCASNSDCGAWTAGTTFASCGENPRLGGATTCGGYACTHDPMCPAAFRCDIATGFCVTR